MLMVKKEDKEKSVLEAMIIPEEDEEEEVQKVNTLQDTIKELGNQAFNKHTKKTSNLSNDNISGIIQCEALNNYMDVNFGYRYSVLDDLVNNAVAYRLSHNGFGLGMLKEYIHGIAASFENVQVPEGLSKLVRR